MCLILFPLSLYFSERMVHLNNPQEISWQGRGLQH